MFVLFSLLFVSFVFLVFAPKGYRPLFWVVFLGILAMTIWVLFMPRWC